MQPAVDFHSLIVISRRCVKQSSLFGDEIQVDAWAKSNQGGVAAQRAEALLHQMHSLYQATGQENLRPTTGIFNAGRTTLGLFGTYLALLQSCLNLIHSRISL